MKKGLLLLALILVIGHLTVPAAMSAETVRFFIFPTTDQDTAFRQFRPMVAYLEGRLGINITVVYPDQTDDFITQFAQSQVDIAYLGPIPYIRLRAVSADAEPLVRFREPSGADVYTCGLVTFPDAVFDPQFSNDRRIALVNAVDVCGYPATARLMDKLGNNINKNKYRYVGKEDEASLSIIRGESDAGGMKTAVARKYSHMGIEILAETDPLPGFVLVGNMRTLGSKMLTQIQSALTALSPDSIDGDLLKTWGEDIRYGTVPAKDTDFDGVRDLLKAFPIPQQGIF